MPNPKILWADDEIALLKPHILFLNQKGFEVKAVQNGHDAVHANAQDDFDVVFLDENMPGMNGLEVLNQIKQQKPHIPVVMITKSEEEHIMEDAIGGQIADYLIKPVNPNQILLSLKKLLDGKTLVSQKTNSAYQQDFRKIGMAFFESQSHEDWIDLYKKLIFWELELEKTVDKSMMEVLQSQKAEANTNFSKFIMKNYTHWVNHKTDNRPTFSPEIMGQKVIPTLKNNPKSTFFILVDCLRYDQWRVFESIIAPYFNIEEESYFSILPTATQYARNAIFAGLYPIEISQQFPKLWLNDDDEGGKNLHEEEFFIAQLQRHKIYNAKTSFHKIIQNEDAWGLVENIQNLLHNSINIIVYNFIDLISHARTEMNLVKELAPDEAAFRSLSRSWFEHSSLLELLKKLREHDVRIFITTDHGTIRVKHPHKIIGDRATTTNLRYKQGKNLNYDKGRQIYGISNPAEIRLPKSNVSSTYAFASEDYFFVYPNNYNYFANFYQGTFQHGGISLEEMVLPFITLTPKK